MDIEMQPYGVFVKTDEKSRIISINSSAFLTDTDGWLLIDSGYGDRFHHAQGNYLPGPLMDDNGIFRYMLMDGQPTERTQAEMDADREAAASPEPSAPSTDAERIAALEQQIEMLLQGVTVDE